ncbi:hypothetical protein MIND_00807500 [Mycena indigotica]|uniref:Uncharacterized protein n=1 Tax=Mycena indigotica TaxID=2126181 RepID=A0A8H6VYB2_9AGAR|nr:uncharacterized protein MIND_00807500 [Mycena indigotica]KAF7298604.1 hypothetical protein MIND_00807500 [Mycena indigotica]
MSARGVIRRRTACARPFSSLLFSLSPSSSSLFLSAMHFTALTAFSALLLSLSSVAAPLDHVRRLEQDGTVQVCSDTDGGGECVPIEFHVTDSSQVPIGDTACTDASAARSIVMQEDDTCVLFRFPDCETLVDGEFRAARETFSNSEAAADIPEDVQSISCGRTPGLVNGLFPQ